MLMPGAEPFYRRGGPVGALLIHGFTGAPREMRPLGDALAAAGLTTLGVRLAQHGTQPRDMFRATWQDWYASVLDGYTVLRDQCETIFVMGLSMGGALALMLATQQPVAGLVVMASPNQPHLDSLDWPTRHAGLLSYVIPFSPKGPRPPTELPGHVHYPVFPLRGVAQLHALVAEVVTVLPQVTAPTLLIYSRADTTVPPANAEYVYAHLGSADKAIVWLERSTHILTEEVEREIVFEQALAFIRAHTPSALPVPARL